MFDFKSKEERQKDADQFFERLFPFGIQQREFLENILKQLFPKHNIVNVLSHCIDAKDKLLLNRKNQGMDDALKSIEKLKPSLSEDELSDLFTLMKLELELDDMDDYPKYTDVRVI